MITAKEAKQITSSLSSLDFNLAVRALMASINLEIYEAALGGQNKITIWRTDFGSLSGKITFENLRPKLEKLGFETEDSEGATEIRW